MSQRFTFILVAAFWLTMTYLLWRSEYIGKNEVGSNIPVSLVWKKILTAPDPSDLQIMRDGKKVGDVQWKSKYGEDLIAAKVLDENATAGSMMEIPSNYRLNMGGHLTVAEIPGRLEFHGETTLSTNNDWQDFNFKLAVPPVSWEFYAQASNQSLTLLEQSKKGGPKTEQIFKFGDLQNPEALLRQFDIPMLGLLGALNPLDFGQKSTTNSLSLGLQWKARNDWIAFGHTSVRAYRLEAVVLERYRMVVIVSQVGEILRVDLPDGWQLMNLNLIDL